MRNRSSNKILALALAAVMLLGILTTPSMTAQAAGIEMASTNDWSWVTVNDTTSATTKVWFGLETHGNSDPATWTPYCWYVIGLDGNGVASESGTMTLLAVEPMGGNDQFNPSGNQVNTYSGSTLYNRLDESDWRLGNIPARERELMIPRDLEGGSANYGQGGYNDDNIVGADVLATKLWPLSVNEANRLDISLRNVVNSYWLRSPGDSVTKAAVVLNAAVNMAGSDVINYYAIRPAFYLDLSFIIFTSAAPGGKSLVAAGDPLASVPAAPTGAVKLTVKDTNLSFSSTPTATGVNGRTITFSYTATANGLSSYNTLSAIVKDSGSTVKYYGKLNDSPEASGTQGSASVTVPDDVGASDSLLIFVEQINGTNFTDYACTPVALSFTAQTAPTGLNGVACVSATDNDGKITGTTTDMEYSADNGQSWTPCTNTETTNLVPASYLVRHTGKMDNGTAYLASYSQTVTVGAYNAPQSGAGPNVAPTSLAITTGQSKTFTVSLGQSGNEADDAAVTSNDTGVATVDITNVAPPGTTVTVTGLSQGTTDITVAFSGGTYTGGDKAVHVAVTDPAPEPPAPQTGRSSDSGGNPYTPTIVGPTIPSTLVVDEAKAKAALAERAKSGASRARIRHTGEIKVLAEAWPVFGNVPIDFDTVSDRAVQVRITVREPGKMTGEKLLSGYVKGSIVDSRKAFFEKWFKNKVQVIHFDQQGSFGQPVEVAAKVDLNGMDTESLYFYSYDKATNSYKRIEKPAYWVDKNGFLHFTTEYAGDIITSEGPLVRKS